jgi:hypothetical protein
MRIIDRVISTLEMFVERQHEEVLDCIPDPNRDSYSNDWRVELTEQASIYETYRNALNSVRRDRNIQNIPLNLLYAVFEHMHSLEEME